MARRVALLCVVLPFLLSLAPPAGAATTAYRVRAYPGVGTFEGVTGDREPGSSGAFWFLQGGYDQKPAVVRMTPDGEVTTWALDSDPRTLFPFRVRRLSSTVLWALVYRQSEGASFLYRLDTATNAVQKVDVPFAATAMEVDPLSGAPVVMGAGRVARYVSSMSMFFIHDVPGFGRVASRPDASGRVFLASDDGSILAVKPSDGTLQRWSGASPTPAFSAIDVAADGTVWGLAGTAGKLVRFRPDTGERTSFPIPLSRYPADGGWVGLSATGPGVTLSSYLGPHFLAADASTLSGGVTDVLGAPETSQLTASQLPSGPFSLTATRTTSTVVPEERVVSLEEDGGKSLATVSGSPLNAHVWGRDGETLTGSRPMQWWRPLASGESFVTEAFLPVAVEVRPEHPTNNFLTEVTLTNLDASPSLTLSLKTSSAEYEVPVTLAAGATRVFPNVVQAFRDLGAPIPGGGATTAGTLRARFTNGRGAMQARVYTRFADSTVFPEGSTTGLAFGSVDPSTEPYVFRRSLNGLKNTSRYRTNLAVASLCGVEGSCPTLSLSAEFFDDATGQKVGEGDFQVPPREWRQLDAPLAGFAGATGERFSVVLTPYQAGTAAYDAYATVIDSQAQDGAFIRAASVGSASVLSVPVVTDACGATCFTSELALTNTSGRDAVADVTYTSVTGTTVTEALPLGNGQGVFWPSAVDHFRQLDPTKVPAGGDYGSVRVLFREFATGFASSRTTASNGTGLGFTGVDPYGERARRRKRIAGLVETPAYRTNLAVVHLGPTTSDAQATVKVRVSLADAAGNPVGTPLEKTLAPGQLHQWARVLSAGFGVSGSGYVATVERVEGPDAFEAYATVIDEVTQDPTFVRAE
ncbi:hypothetical protein FBQ97_02910 [Acidobacteria bacterium ACD]|nr:hypothetical protein [Acidobacteria bacterium ACD]